MVSFVVIAVLISFMGTLIYLQLNAPILNVSLMVFFVNVCSMLSYHTQDIGHFHHPKKSVRPLEVNSFPQVLARGNH